MTTWEDLDDDYDEEDTNMDLMTSTSSNVDFDVDP